MFPEYINVPSLQTERFQTELRAMYQFINMIEPCQNKGPLLPCCAYFSSLPPPPSLPPFLFLSFLSCFPVSLFSFCVFVFEIRPCYIAQAGLELKIPWLFIPLPKCRGTRAPYHVHLSSFEWAMALKLQYTWWLKPVYLLRLLCSSQDNSIQHVYSMSALVTVIVFKVLTIWTPHFYLMVKLCL